MTEPDFCEPTEAEGLRLRANALRTLAEMMDARTNLAATLGDWPAEKLDIKLSLTLFDQAYARWSPPLSSVSVEALGSAVRRLWPKIYAEAITELTGQINEARSKVL